MTHTIPEKEPQITVDTVIAVVLVLSLYIIPILGVARFFLDFSNAMAGL